jgi:hypothetical protein
MAQPPSSKVTGMRLPRMQASPPQTSGVRVMRSVAADMAGPPVGFRPEALGASATVIKLGAALLWSRASLLFCARLRCKVKRVLRGRVPGSREDCAREGPAKFGVGGGAFSLFDLLVASRLAPRLGKWSAT